MERNIRTGLIGLGNVNRHFLHILETRAARLQQQYGLAFRVVCVADSSGVALQPAGFDPAHLYRHKTNGGRVSELVGFQPGAPVVDVLPQAHCDLILEATPVNLEHGEPGLSVVRTALQHGIHVVLANKGPLVLAFHELHAIAATTGARLGYSATVCGALPVINLGTRDHIADTITLFRGILNATSNFILDEMTAGRPYEEALRIAQEHGIAETDPTLDVAGWDTANKLVIIANSFLGSRVTLEDVTVQGITHLGLADLQAAQAQGRRLKLLAIAEYDEAGYRLRVEPVSLPHHEFLAQCRGFEMGVEFHSDLYGITYHKIWEDSPLPTAAAMLRDAVNLFTEK